MPTYPYSNNQVSDQALPGVRVNTQQPVEAFGGGTDVSEPEKAVQSLGTTIDDITQRSFVAANTAAKIQTQNFVDAHKVSGLYGTTDGSGNQIPGLIQQVSQAGQNAPAVYDSFKQTYDDTMAKQRMTLPNDDQRAAFDNQAADGWRDIDKTIQPHITATIQKFASDQVDTALTNGVNWGTANYNNPDEVEAAKEKMINTTQSWGVTHGMTGDQMTAKMAQPISNLYKNVVEQYYVNGQYDQGTAYFKSIQDQVPDAAIKNSIGKMVQEQTLKGNSQKTAADILTNYTDDSSAMAAVSDIKDPELQNMVRPLVREGVAVQNKQTQNQYNNNVMTALDQVDKGGSVSSIMPSLYGTLGPKERDALQAYSQNKNGSIPIKNDPQTFNDYMSMQPGDLAKVTPAEVITDVRPNLDDMHFQQFKAQWQNAQAGIGGNQTKLNDANDVIKQKDQITQAFSNASIAGSEPGWELQHINSSPKTRIAYDEFEQSVQAEIDSQKQIKGRALTAEEVGGIAKGVARQNVVTDSGGIFSSPTNKNVSQIVNDPALEVNRIPITNLKDTDKQALYVQGVQSGGIPPTMDPQTAYLKYRTNFEKAAGAAAKGASLPEIKAIMGAKY